MSLRSVDMNLLIILRELLKERSVSAAGRTIGMSHSAVSEALGRLRFTLGDPLLVRVGRRMELTPRGSEMIAEVENLCSDLERFFRKADFDPASTRRKFVIAASDLLALQFSRQLMNLLGPAAPGMCLHFTQIDPELVKRMSNREIDFALIPGFAIDDLAPAPLHYRPLSTGGTVALMASDHPLAAQTSVSCADLLQFRHINFQPDAVRSHAKRFLELNGGETFDVSCHVAQFALVPHLLTGTNQVALVPEQLGLMVEESYRLRAVPLAFKSAQTDVGIAWSPVYVGDPAHKWFRNLVDRRFRRYPRAVASQTKLIAAGAPAG